MKNELPIIHPTPADFDDPAFQEPKQGKRRRRELRFDHLIAMPTDAELGAAMAQGKKAVAKIYFKAWNRQWYKLAEVPVSGIDDKTSIADWHRTVEKSDYHHAVRYGKPLKKTDLPQFLFKRPAADNPLLG